MPDDGVIRLVILDFDEPSQKIVAEDILNDEECEVLEERVYASAKGDVRIYIKYKKLE